MSRLTIILKNQKVSEEIRAEIKRQNRAWWIQWTGKKAAQIAVGVLIGAFFLTLNGTQAMIIFGGFLAGSCVRWMEDNLNPKDNAK